MSRNRTSRNTLIRNGKYNPRRRFPCWCGESLVKRYRTMEPCCHESLWWLATVDLSAL